MKFDIFWLSLGVKGSEWPISQEQKEETPQNLQWRRIQWHIGGVHQKIFEPKIFFWTQKFFLVQNYLWPKKISKPTFLWSKKNLWTQNYLGPKKFWVEHFFWIQNLFRTQIFFWPRIFFRPKIFSDQEFFSDPKLPLDGGNRASTLEAF